MVSLSNHEVAATKAGIPPYRISTVATATSSRSLRGGTSANDAAKVRKLSERAKSVVRISCCDIGSPQIMR